MGVLGMSHKQGVIGAASLSLAVFFGLNPFDVSPFAVAAVVAYLVFVSLISFLGYVEGIRGNQR